MKFRRTRGSFLYLLHFCRTVLIEVPMVLISAGLGLRLGYSMYFSMKGEKIDMRFELIESLHIFMRIIMPLLFVSAMIETF